MGEVANHQHFQDQGMKNNIYDPNNAKFGSWAIMSGNNGFDHDENDSISMDSSYEDSSTNSGTSSSSDLMEDASSSTSSYSSLSSSMSHSKGPLYELSDLMLQLPIKRGLSKYYQGKSQSYTSLAHVQSIDDLAKKGVSYSKRMKSCKSYANGLDGHKLHSPKATISKKTSPRVSFLSLQGSRGTLVTNCKPPISS